MISKMNQQQREYEEEQPTFCSVPLALTPARPIAMPPMLGGASVAPTGSVVNKDESKLPAAKKVMAPMSFKAIKPPMSFKSMKPLGKYTRQTTLKAYVVTTQSE